MSKYKIIALFGKSASGKDTIQKWLVSNFPCLHSIVSCTTRPIRENEEEGIDYYFLNNEEFGIKVLDGTMLEATSFNNWFYGTPIDSLQEDCINIGVFNIAGIEALLEDSHIQVYPVFIDCDDKTRLLRSLNREEKPNCAEICRRFVTDEADFQTISFDYNYYLNEGMKEFDNDHWKHFICLVKKDSLE